MAEDDGKEGMEGLGQHDVKTGVYEGGFKSWESSVDLVKVLATEKDSYWSNASPLRVIEVRPLDATLFQPCPLLTSQARVRNSSPFSSHVLLGDSGIIAVARSALHRLRLQPHGP